ncbi:casein kinase I-like [Ylistrum balloti]|uniref:casein kinase I-like n=1 Tax=Ylistrum balloti TaxID=509963 RepID=UPI002905CAAF|nr:casein kinase I-like [Ylistrum balloti]
MTLKLMHSSAKRDVFYTERTSNQQYDLYGQKGNDVTGTYTKGSNWMFLILNRREYYVNNDKTFIKDRVVYSSDNIQSDVRELNERHDQRLFADSVSKEMWHFKVRDGTPSINGTPKKFDLGKWTNEQNVANRYLLERELGKDNFGKVYLGTNLLTGKQVAVKVHYQSYAYLRHEYNVYKEIQGGDGIPKVMWYGREGKSDVMVMELLGASLQDRFVTHSRKFSLKMVLLLAEAMINRLEYIHSHGFIYRDVKPGHFLTGLGNKENSIYIVDFGLSKRFRDTNTQEHIPYIANKSFVGSLTYASVNSQLGIQQSRRDDMESLGYVLVYFLRGTLPWLEANYKTTKEKYAETLDQKMTISKQSLCYDCPVEFFIYIKICQSIKFAAKPDYVRLRNLFKNVFTRYNFTLDQKFGWRDSTTGREERHRDTTTVNPLVKRWLYRK